MSVTQQNRFAGVWDWRWSIGRCPHWDPNRRGCHTCIGHARAQWRRLVDTIRGNHG